MAFMHDARLSVRGITFISSAVIALAMSFAISAPQPALAAQDSRASVAQATAIGVEPSHVWRWVDDTEDSSWNEGGAGAWDDDWDDDDIWDDEDPWEDDWDDDDSVWDDDVLWDEDDDAWDDEWLDDDGWGDDLLVDLHDDESDNSDDDDDESDDEDGWWPEDEDWDAILERGWDEDGLLLIEGPDGQEVRIYIYLCGGCALPSVLPVDAVGSLSAEAIQADLAIAESVPAWSDAGNYAAGQPAIADDDVAVAAECPESLASPRCADGGEAGCSSPREPHGNLGRGAQADDVHGWGVLAEGCLPNRRWALLR